MKTLQSFGLIPVPLLFAFTTAWGGDANRQAVGVTPPTSPDTAHSGGARTTPARATVHPDGAAATTAPAATSAMPPAINIPDDLHFSPADLAYLASVDAATREAAMHRQREDLQAIRRSFDISQGYTDFLKDWRISGSTAMKAGLK